MHCVNFRHISSTFTDFRQLWSTFVNFRQLSSTFANLPAQCPQARGPPPAAPHPALLPLALLSPAVPSYPAQYNTPRSGGIARYSQGHRHSAIDVTP
eukprot:1372425-Rhodomonas_salina.1